MKELNWVQIIVGFFSGGAFGAILKQFFDNKKNKIQTIKYKLDLKQFYDSYSENMIASKIVIQEDGKDYRFETLYTGTISIFNTGNSDFKEFLFGMTYDDDTKIIQIRQNNFDRHHVAKFDAHPSLENQISQFDIILNPFNRGDRYDFDFIVSTTGPIFSEDHLQVTSSHSVRLKKMNTEKELVTVFSKHLINSIWSGLPSKI